MDGSPPEALPAEPAGPSKRRRRLAGIPPMDGAEVRYDDLTRLPQVGIDDNGFAVRPTTPADAHERAWSLVERQVRWLLFWNWSAGNKTVACQEAGVSRDIADAWCKGTEFKRHMERAQEEIADRLLLRVAQRTGLLPLPEGVKVHDASLFGLAKKYKPDMFGDMSEPAAPVAVRPEHSIPRPPKASGPEQCPFCGTRGIHNCQAGAGRSYGAVHITVPGNIVP